MHKATEPAPPVSPVPGSLDGPVDFSLIQGGPFFQLLLRTGLLKPPTDLLRRRMVAVLIITWVPPGFSSILEPAGTARPELNSRIREMPPELSVA